MCYHYTAQSNATLNKFTDKMKSIFNEKLNQISDLYVPGLRRPKTVPIKMDSDKIVFVLPLSGRYEIFLRFLNNFEDVS